MSSSGGLSSYSPLFASGLHQTVREQAVESHFPRNKGPSRAQQYPSNVPSRRPSGADTYAESTYSRRSSMPTFYSGSSDYRQDRSRAANYPVPSPGISFTPSVLFRADTIVTKRSGNPPQRSNFQSFLSLDVNDPIQHAPPSLNSTQARFIAISRSNDSRKQARPVSVNSSLWALPLHSPGPFEFHNPPLEEETILEPQLRDDEFQTLPLIAPELYEEGGRTPTVSQGSSPPKYIHPGDISPSTTPSRDNVTFLTARSNTSSPTPSSIPLRPQYEPRVRTPMAPTASLSTTDPRLRRNLSVTSASTTTSFTPSQKRVRRDEALARLEGKDYDPAPLMATSLMPFESDEEEEEEEYALDSEFDSLSITEQNHFATVPQQLYVPAIQSPPPSRRQPAMQFVEVERPDSLFEDLDAVSEASFISPSPSQFHSYRSNTPSPPIPEPIPRSRNQDYRPPQLMWPPVDSEEELPRPPLLPLPSPLSAITLSPAPPKSATSLASFSPFSSPEMFRMRKISNSARTPGSSNPTTPGKGFLDQSVESFPSVTDVSNDRSRKGSGPNRKSSKAHKSSNDSKKKKDQSDFQFETWLDMSGDETSEAPKKKRWPDLGKKKGEKYQS